MYLGLKSHHVVFLSADLHRHVSLRVIKGDIKSLEEGSAEHYVVRVFLLILAFMPLNQKVALRAIRLEVHSILEERSVRTEVGDAVIELDIHAEEVRAVGVGRDLPFEDVNGFRAWHEEAAHALRAIDALVIILVVQV